MERKKIMSQKLASFMKYCATCNYWMGPRTTDYFGYYSEIPDTNTRAKCMCPHGPWRNQERSAIVSCPAYEKWSVLK